MVINPKFWDDLLELSLEDFRKQNELLDEQFKRELAKIKFRGPITKEKVKRHGFKFIIQQGVGTYITKNGVRVTDVFCKPFEVPYMGTKPFYEREFPCSECETGEMEQYPNPYGITYYECNICGNAESYP